VALTIRMYSRTRATRTQRPSMRWRSRSENNELESYRPKLKDMEAQLANLKQQLEIERASFRMRSQVDTFHHDDGRRSPEGGRGSAPLCG